MRRGVLAVSTVTVIRTSWFLRCRKHGRIVIWVAEVGRSTRIELVVTWSCLVDGDCFSLCDNDLDKICTSPSQCGGANCIETGPCVDMGPGVGPVSNRSTPLSWFVKQPQQIEDGCLPTGCTDEDWIARLSQDVYSEDWSAYSVRHIGDCPIDRGESPA